MRSRSRNGFTADRVIIDEVGKARPLELQTWRRHHGLRVVDEAPASSLTSGCSRRRRKAIERRNREAEILQRRSHPLAAAFQDLTRSAVAATHALRDLSDAIADA